MTENLQLKEAGLKTTTHRLKVLTILEQSPNHHLSAENVYKIMRDMGEEISLATIYRMLTQFETAGLVARHYFESGTSIFELQHGEHHDHLVCVKCNQVEEFLDKIIEQRQEIIANKANFKMTDHSLTIYGLCINCQN